jgi:RimJ/RimL family protein N-acetyltransferase
MKNIKNYKYKFFNFEKIKIEDYEIKNISSKDIETIRLWRNQSIKYLRQNKKISKKNQSKYFKKYIQKQKSLKKPKDIIFLFKKNSNLIGYGGLVHISWENKNAELSFLLNPKIFSKKIHKLYFEKCIDLLINFSFKVCKLKKIYTQTFSYRKTNINLLKKSGFSYEGLLKKHLFKKKKFYNIIIQSIINKNQHE